MKCAFCFLEKDEKTYGYIKKYFSIIKDGLPPISMDNFVQKQEIERYLINNNRCLHDRGAITEWINDNSSDFRSYLNSIKMVALFIYFINRSNKSGGENPIPFDVFCDAVSAWNDRKSELVDSLFI